MEKIKTDDDKKQTKEAPKPTDDETVPEDSDSTDEKKDEGENKAFKDTKDYPLYEALNLLKGISIIRK